MVALAARALPVRALTALCAVVLASSPLGCAPPPDLVLEPDPARGAALGEEGPFGVLVERRTARVRGDEPLSLVVAVPTMDGETPHRAPPALIIQGGLVEAARYEWIARHLASRGLVAILPSHGLDLAFFSTGNGLEALDVVRRASRRSGDFLEGAVASSRGLVLGHSLGGVVGTALWLDNPGELSHLVLLASIPNPSDDVGALSGGRVLSVAGGADGRITTDEVVEGAASFTASTRVAVVAGMTHYQWVDGVTETERDSDAPITVDTAATRRLGMFLVDAMVADLVEGHSDVLDLPSIWPAGLAPPPGDTP